MRYFKVKNLEKFQHYSKRTPPWIKLYNNLLNDYEFGNLPDASKCHLMLIWLIASRTQNKIPYDVKWITKSISATEEVDLVFLEDAGFIEILDDASILLASCKQSASTEKEREREGETERETEREPESCNKIKSLKDIKIDMVSKDWLKENNIPASMDLSLELAKAIDWTKNKGKKHKEPLAFYRNWLRNAAEYKRSKEPDKIKTDEIIINVLNKRKKEA